MNVSAIVATSMQGVQAATSKVERHAEALASAQLEPKHFVGLLEGERAAEVNLAAIRVADDMAGSLLDVLA
jgi:hypothetical protein